MNDMHAKELQEQVAGTYKNLRYGLAIIAFAFPVFLMLVGVL